MEFSKNLARLMKERGVTNYKLAKDIEISQTTVANWLNGVSKPGKLYINTLCGYFGCTKDELLKADKE